MTSCTDCGVLLLRAAARCPSCLGFRGLRPSSVEPAVTRRELQAAAAVLLGGVPVLTALDLATVWLLRGPAG